MNIPTMKLFGALFVVSGMAFAGAPSATGSTQPQPPGQIVSEQQSLRERLDRHGGEFARFDAAAISKMERAQDKVFGMLRGVSSLAQLNAQQKTDLSNALDEIKAILLANEGNRQICHRERKMGSNFVQLRCETMAEREYDAQQSRRAMQDISRTPQTKSGN